MFGKFMVDSTAYWAEEYKLDGLRFDLMGLHDLATMQEVESAVHTVNPNAIIYGEGWTMGATIDGSAQANQSNISKITSTGDAIGGIAVFNDAIRDGLKGSVFDAKAKGYISGSSKGNVIKVVFGIKGARYAIRISSLRGRPCFRYVRHTMLRSKTYINTTRRSRRRVFRRTPFSGFLSKKLQKNSSQSLPQKPHQHLCRR